VLYDIAVTHAPSFHVFELLSGVALRFIKDMQYSITVKEKPKSAIGER
jgi:hypothetical protein